MPRRALQSLDPGARPGGDASAALTVPPTVKGLSLVSLFNDFASEMVYPLLPAFVTGSLGGGPMILGLLDGAADLTSAALKFWSGRLADRPGWRKPLILLGYATAILVRPLIAVAGAAWQVVGFRVVDRVGKGLRTPPRDALIAAVSPLEVRGRAFGFHRAADHFGAVIGSLAAWYLLTRGAEVRSVIGWSVVPGLLAFVLLAAVLRGAPPPAAPEPRGATPAADARGRVFWGPILALTALTLFRLPEALLLLRLQQQGVAVAAVPLVWAGLHVVRSASSYPGGWLSDRLGPRLAVAAGGVVFAMVAAALSVELGVAWAIAVFLTMGLVAGLTEGAERALVARLAPVRTGRGFGVYHALIGLAALPAGLAFGAVYQDLGPHQALLASAVGVAAAVMVWLMITADRTAGETR
ncbi:MAG TPA: MFS transporter [Gemmatimonadales bacterium]|nr:MFS transporter [Gemmatimonadales bacterium]